MSARSRSRSARRALPLAVLVLAVPCVLAADAGQASAALLPVETCRGVFVVTVTYDDDPGRTLDLLLDTGAERTIVDPDALRRVFGRSVRPGRRATLRGGRAGPLRIRRQRVQAADVDHLGRALARPIDGILGFDVFRDLLLTLDYPAGEVRVAKGRLPPIDGKTIFEDVGRKRPFLRIALSGRPLVALMDSGFTGGLDLRPGEVSRWRESPRDVSAAVRFSDVVLVRAGRADETIGVGPLELTRPIVRESRGTRLIGEDVLRHAAWTFDAAGGRIRIDPAAPAAIELPPLVGTGAAFRPAARGLEVLRVFPGTAAADAGLREGDVVVTWRGRPVYERECAPIVPDEASAAVPLVVERDGRPLQVELGARVLVP